VVPRAAESLPGHEAPIVLIATDGELYGHHQTFREMFLKRLVQPQPDRSDVRVDIATLEAVLREDPDRPFATTRIVERTSWSCHHGVMRWSGECPCTPGATWKAPLRSALERLAAGIDVLTERQAAGLAGRPDPWAARNAFVDVVVGAEEERTFLDRWLGAAAPSDDHATLRAHMDIQRGRRALFARDGWFWEEPVRTETMMVLRAASWAARRMDALAGSGLERRLVADLAVLISPAHQIDGAEIYRRALAEVGEV
jgi:hypothetical protein